MNWVGGARSRVRQNAEKKLQKDFFERRKLASKVQRIKPSLSKVKTAASQDLLFLKATASATKSRPASPGGRIPKVLSLEPSGGGKGKGRFSMRPQRDMELPMSPIGKTSSLDIMDTSTTLSESLRLGAEFDARLPMGELPRVSTQKIPHRTILGSFGPPRRIDVDAERGRRSSGDGTDVHTVPTTEDNHLLNMSTMTESLFPPPTKRHKKHNKENTKKHCGHKYSLDDILDQNRAILLDQDYHTGQRGGGGGGGGGKPAIASAFGQDRADSIFAIAKGGWQPRVKRAPLKPSVLPAEGKHLAGHRFDFWRPTAAKEEMPWPGARRRNVGVVSTEDSDAVLELHYAEETRESRPYVEETRESRPYVEETRESRPYVEETRESRSHYGDADTQKETSSQLVPLSEITEKDGPVWKPRRDERRKDERRASRENVLPWLNSAKSASSTFSENPFSGRKVPGMLIAPPVSTSIDFDESILGPLHRHVSDHRNIGGGHMDTRGGHMDTRGGHVVMRGGHMETRGGHMDTRRGHMDSRSQNPTRQDKCSPTDSLDKTQFNESILAPILAARNAEKKEVSSKASASTAEESNKHTTSGKKLSAAPRKRSAFEVMMAALEKPSKVHRNLPMDKKNLLVDKKSLSMDKERNLVQNMGHCQSDQDQKPKPHSKAFKTTNLGNLSVLQELMCLEEEIVSHHCEDGFLSQNSPVEIENSEDPLCQQASKEDSPCQQEGPICQQASKEGPICQQASKEGPICQQASKEGPICQQASKEGPICRPASKEGPICRPASKEGPICRPASKEGPIWQAASRSSREDSEISNFIENKLDAIERSGPITENSAPDVISVADISAPGGMKDTEIQTDFLEKAASGGTSVAVQADISAPDGTRDTSVRKILVDRNTPDRTNDTDIQTDIECAYSERSSEDSSVKRNSTFATASTQTEEFSSSKTQTSEQEIASGSEPVFGARLLHVEVASSATQTSSTSAYEEAIMEPSQQICWNLTNEHLTLGLERYREIPVAMAEQDGGMLTRDTETRYSDIAVQVTRIASCCCSRAFELGAGKESCFGKERSPSHHETKHLTTPLAGTTEAEALQQRLCEVEEKLLTAESTVIWQSLMMRLQQNK